MVKRVALALGVLAAVFLAAAWLLPAVTPGGQAEASTLSGRLILAGSTSVQPLAEELAEEFMARNPKVRIQVQGGGSSAGITAAKSGAANLGMSSRELKPEESGLQEIRIALDGIAVVVHPRNSVKKLTTEQIRKIYAGEITNWKQVGGKDAPIMVVTREAGSGTRGAFTELVMQEAMISTKAIVQGSTGAVQSTVAQAANAIGYVSLGSLDESVKAIPVDGVVASEANVKAKTYKIARPFLFLSKTKPTGLTKAFIDFVLSKDGQNIVAQEFVPVGR